MGKVSVGLRGWRFEESEIFTADGEFRPLEELSEDDSRRLRRLPYLVEQPCDACYLIHGEWDEHHCRQAAVVYGEPMDEVVLCDDHEQDFVYWYREAGGSALRGAEEFRDAFHEWFADGGRAPERYGGLEHVDTDPEGLPDPPDPEEIQARLEAEFEGRRIDLREAAAGDGGGSVAADAVMGADGAAPDADEDDAAAQEADGADDVDDRDGADGAEAAIDDIDLGQDYPTR